MHVTDSLELSVSLGKKQPSKGALQGRQGTAAAGHHGNGAMRLISNTCRQSRQSADQKRVGLWDDIILKFRIVS